MIVFDTLLSCMYTYVRDVFECGCECERKRERECENFCIHQVGEKSLSRKFLYFSYHS